MLIGLLEWCNRSVGRPLRRKDMKRNEKRVIRTHGLDVQVPTLSDTASEISSLPLRTPVLNFFSVCFVSLADTTRRQLLVQK